MKHWTHTLAIFLTFAFAAATLAQDVTLKVGDPAPPLAQGEYLKGEPVTEFEEGTVYVLEFWATWCGPCIAAIPHVTELQQEYSDQVVIIGQNVWEQDDAAPAPFVADMGDKMDYRVALDDKSQNPQGAMADTWLRAAGQNGIPCSIIVDQQGMVAWIGHPMAMDEPLKKIVAGNYDAAAEAEASQKAEALNEKISRAMADGDFETALPLFDEFAELQPAMTDWVNLTKFEVLANMGRFDQAHELARETVDRTEESAILNGIAWMLVSPDSAFEDPQLDLALDAAEKANTLTDDSDPAILDTLARVHHLMGDNGKAIEIQQKAVSLAEEPALINELKKTLADYRTAQ